MKILVLGATGRTGRHVLEFALAAGYQVNCLVRNQKKMDENQQLTIFEGSCSNAADLNKAMQGCEAIISVLNISRKTDFPWSRLRTPKNFLSKVMANVIQVSAKNDIRRIVLCSAWGVAETRKNIPFWFRLTIEYSNIKYAYIDHEKQEELLENSDLGWTIVRPVGLLNSDAFYEVKESFDNYPKPNLTISRKSLARYLVSCLNVDKLVCKKVVIST